MGEERLMFVVKTVQGKVTHVAAESEFVNKHPELKGFASVKCGAIRNSGTKTIKVCDDVNRNTVTCEKCRSLFNL